MNLEKVIFAFFIVLALTLNFGFYVGEIDNPVHHSIYELYAALVVSLIATVLKFGERTQIGAVLLATSLVADLQLIAAAIVNRLRKGMPLQMDPTVIYGMGAEFQGNIRKKDLQTPTPYNTYTNKGLPPTPIALASAESIYAVLHPAQSDVLYFVAKGDGSHVFSSTLEAHNAAVRQYQLGIKP